MARNYRVVYIPKRSGNGRRRIAIPDRALKAVLRTYVPGYNEIALVADSEGVMHGFMPHRSAVTNALVHVGFQWTVTFDLRDFFDTVTRQMLSPTILAPDECYVEGALAQGLPTSPPLANIAASPLDKAIVARQRVYRNNVNFVYTRYADDLTFSTNSRDVVQMLLLEIPRLVLEHGFEVNDRKTRVQWAGAGQRIITGVAVGPGGIHPTRQVKRKIRAARHQLGHLSRGETLESKYVRTKSIELRRQWGLKGISPLELVSRSLRGLEEWSSLKRPHKEIVPPRQAKVGQPPKDTTTLAPGQAVQDHVIKPHHRPSSPDS